ncbi:hypothetical protein [Sanguibacter inulinus]|uniref:Uncharacterized protein n=1 Tax=Sanguibacter inulinus TaxID=60922 RepID=A0A853EQJ3_9MICO|nr:hypothetical protein [Sanguibacter inulinus]MBF0721472.1 hypothetical protein [Sanguibacter inulinus]NYS92617.1 hypothetical protein [Sanguibacter inulinus]
MSAFTTSTHEVAARIFLPLHGPGDSRWPWEGLVAQVAAQVAALDVAHDETTGAADSVLTPDVRWSDLERCLESVGRTGLRMAYATPGRVFSVALAAVLGEHTATPDECWFFLWEGYAGETDGLDTGCPPWLTGLARRSGGLVPHRAPVSWLGARTADDEHLRLPVFVWPDDGSFLLACPIYHDSLYISCSTDLVDRLREASFEVLLVDRDAELPGECD